MSAANPSARVRRILGLFPELLGVGGVQEAGRQTAAALLAISVRAGLSARFLGLNDAPGEQEFSACGSRVHLRGFGRSKVRFVAAAMAAARCASNSDGLVVVAGHPHLALPAAIIKLVSPSVCVVVQSHGIEVWNPMSAIRRNAFLRADLVLGPSSDTARKLQTVQGVAAKRIRKVAWPVDPKILQMAGAPSALPLPQAFPAGQVVLTVGRWAASERYKGVDHLIEAVAQLSAENKGLNLVAVGSGDDLPRLKKLAADAGVSGRVKFLEGLSREQLGACYAHCDIFALPSTGEGFGLVFLEANAFGKPVIGAGVGGTTDLIEDGVNGLLVRPGDTQHLASTIRRLLEEEPLRRELGCRGAKIVREKYGFAAFEAGIEKVLGECGLDSGARA